MIRGEVGSLTRGGFGATEDVRVEFSDQIENAVIMLTSTNAGGNEFSLVVTSVDAKGFTFRVSEWEDEDGPHPATETINWIAVTPGVHALPDGRVIEAGTTTATTESSAVALEGSFAKPPVVLTNRMSLNEKDVADSDPFDVTTTGFNVALQEGSLSDGVSGGETVGYIAISQGGDAAHGSAMSSDSLATYSQSFDLGAEFKQGVSFAETQTRNETDAGNVHFKKTHDDATEAFYFDEEGGDGEEAHGAESFGIVTFEQGVIPCYTTGTRIVTMTGERDITDLRPGDAVLTRDNGFQTLRWVSKTQITRERLLAEPDLAPIVIRKDAIAPGLPVRDMVVSPQHRMLLQGWKAELLTGAGEVLVPAKALVDGETIVQAGARNVDYYHILFDEHQIIYADGAASESLHAAQIRKTELTPAARAMLHELLPDLQLGYGPTARPCVTVKQGRAFVA